MAKSQARVELDWLVEGYRNALTRLPESAEGTLQERFIPLFEALNWSVAIADHPKGHMQPQGEALSTDPRDPKISDAGLRSLRGSD